MIDPITLRKAELSDVAVLEIWDNKPHIIATSGNDEKRNWLGELARPMYEYQRLIAEVNGRPIGYLEILNPHQDKDQYWGTMPEGFRAIDIWIGEESEIGKGYGAQMMQQALSLCFRKPDVHTILIDPLYSNFKARRFYEKLGFKKLERKRFGADDCMIYRLFREEWQNDN